MRERAAAHRLRRSCAPAPVAALLALVAAVAAPAAAAEEVTAGELHELVQRARSDPGAVSELRRVDRVDGRPVDLEAALAGASGAGLEARLRALDAGPNPAASAPAPTGDAGPRAEARRILEDRRYHPGAVPRPFRGLFRTLGRWLRPVTGPVGRAWSSAFDNAVAVGILGAAVVGVAALVSVRTIRRRSAAGVARSRRARGPGRHDDPDDLERQAAEAEQAGELALALRLRFRAGLVRLDRAGAVVDRPALTAGALTSQLPSTELRELADAFEEIAYGGRPASPEDVSAARAGWPRVLDEVAR